MEQATVGLTPSPVKRRFRSGEPMVARLLGCCREAASGCWLWQRAKTPDGYGQINSGKIRILAHRAAYEAFVTPIPVGVKVLHECDVPACINPAHLFLGSQKDNVQDCITKGRRVILRGELSGPAILTQSTVDQLRKDFSNGTTISSLSRLNGVSRAAIRCVIRRVTWK